MTDIDTEIKNTNVEPEITESAVMVSEPSVKKPSYIPMVFALFAIALSICVAIFCFYLYQSSRSNETNYEKQITALTTQLASQTEKQNALLQQDKLSTDTFKTQVEQLNLQILDTKNKSKLYGSDIQTLQRDIAETQVRRPNDWILTEVEYLINLAGRKLWLEHDISTTVSLMAAADQRIVEMGDPSLNPLRKALVEDINMLESLPKQDTDSAALMLSSLEQRIDKLPMVGLEMPDPGDNTQTDVSKNVGDWKENLGKSWQAFIENFVVVSHRDTDIKALLSPKQAWYLKENLRNNLSKAEFSLYREQQDIYDIALLNSLQLIEQYYDISDTNTQQFYKSLQDLSKQKISATYPDQFKSAPLLSRTIKQRMSKSPINGNVE